MNESVNVIRARVALAGAVVMLAIGVASGTAIGLATGYVLAQHARSADAPAGDGRWDARGLSPAPSGSAGLLGPTAAPGPG